MKIRENIAEAFQVDNNPEGLAEVSMIKKLFKGSDYKIISRGRNENRRKAIEAVGLTYGRHIKQDIPVKYATRLAVYIIHKKTGVHLKNFWARAK